MEKRFEHCTDQELAIGIRISLNDIKEMAHILALRGWDVDVDLDVKKNFSDSGVIISKTIKI